ncbi:MAG TPA: Ada metal-binding domain-containing protein, partial [Paenibacillus sp.]|nr:Ada metal-binding domain-containing protein [Paenibacillus sp.]
MKDEWWNAIVGCDRAYDGLFYYGVSSTGIFCKPSCRSKTPRKDKTVIFGNVQEALLAGFRSCKRCCPEEFEYNPDARLVDKVTSLIKENYHSPLSLEELAQPLAVSPSHLHRIFKRVTGMTPNEMLTRTRINEAKHLLETYPTKSITEVAFEVGYQSLSHFSVTFKKAT